jgi:hypothetical protein
VLYRVIQPLEGWQLKKTDGNINVLSNVKVKISFIYVVKITIIVPIIYIDCAQKV